MELPNIDKSPYGVVKAVEDYCIGEGTFYNISQALDVPYDAFAALMEWFVANSFGTLEPFSCSPDRLLCLICLLLLNSYKKELTLQRKKITTLEKRLGRK